MQAFYTQPLAMFTGRSSGDWDSSNALQKMGRMAQISESVSESNARL